LARFGVSNLSGKQMRATAVFASSAPAENGNHRTAVAARSGRCLVHRHSALLITTQTATQRPKANLETPVFAISWSGSNGVRPSAPSMISPRCRSVVDIANDRDRCCNAGESEGRASGPLLSWPHRVGLRMLITFGESRDSRPYCASLSSKARLRSTPHA
jgi:hypothetical protein